MDYLVIQNPERVRNDILKDKKAVSIPGGYQDQRVTFQAAMKVTVILGQFVGLNPVLGVCNVDTSKLRFTYLSGRCAYTIITIILQSVFLNVLFLLKYFKDSETSIAGNTSLVFYTSNTIITVLFLQIGIKWPKLCRYISWTEAVDPVMDNALVRKCDISCLLVLSLACVEYSLAELSGLVSAADCNPPAMIYEAYIVLGFTWINDLVNYTVSLGTLSQNFISVMESIFTLAQWFGIPTYGGYLALLWAVIMLAMLTTIEVTAIWKLCRLLSRSAGRNITATLSGSIFYGNALLSLILSWKAVKTWQSLATLWTRIEDNGLFLLPDVSIRRRVFYVSMFVAVSAVVEHTLSMISATGVKFPFQEYLERYILSSHGFLLHSYEYSLWLAIPIFILSKSATILWNFQDLIIILISMGLSSRYHRLNCFVKQVVRYEIRALNEKKVRLGGTPDNNIYIWRQIRQSYVQQSALVRKVDTELGMLILLSNLNNLYFICLQLFLGIRSFDGTLINRIYYFYSLGWLLLRACSVVLAAADVNLHSKRALSFLYACPSSAYNIEIRRLKNQLNHDVVALSGMGFFYLDRQKLLEVVAAIVKYELILLQYDK